MKSKFREGQRVRFRAVVDLEDIIYLEVPYVDRAEKEWLRKHKVPKHLEIGESVWRPVGHKRANRPGDQIQGKIVFEIQGELTERV